MKIRKIILVPCCILVVLGMGLLVTQQAQNSEKVYVGKVLGLRLPDSANDVHYYLEKNEECRNIRMWASMSIPLEDVKGVVQEIGMTEYVGEPLLFPPMGIGCPSWWIPLEQQVVVVKKQWRKTPGRFFVYKVAMWWNNEKLYLFFCGFPGTAKTNDKR